MGGGASRVAYTGAANQKVGRNVGIDLAKALATLGVVTLHFVGPQAGSINAALYLLASFSIPVFVMCNGYFVLNKIAVNWRYSVWKAVDLLVLALLWCVVNWALFAMARRNMGVWGVFSPLHDFLACAMQRGDNGIFWYLWMLAGLELSVPVVVAARNRFGWLPLLVVLAVICLSVDVAAIIVEARGGVAVQSCVPQSLRVWTWFLYFCLGGALGSADALKRLFKRSATFSLAMLTVVAVAGVLLWGYGVRWRLWGMAKAEYLYDDPTVVLLSVSLLLLCDVGCMSVIDSRVSRIIASVSAAGLGVYVLQVPLRAFQQRFYRLENPLINLVLVPIAYLLLLGMTLLLEKLPALNCLVRIGWVPRHTYEQQLDGSES